MDGKFVPNTTPGVGMLKKINKFNFVFDTHLMVEDPINYIDKFYKAGSDIITFHYEAVKDVLPIIRKIKSLGIKCGISIKPGTSPEVLLPYLKELDQILVMSVEPGFGGQKFMEEILYKIEENEAENLTETEEHKEFISDLALLESGELKPEDDLSYYLNYLDTHVFMKHIDFYRRYMENTVDDIEYKMGWSFKNID